MLSHLSAALTLLTLYLPRNTPLSVYDLLGSPVYSEEGVVITFTETVPDGDDHVAVLDGGLVPEDRVAATPAHVWVAAPLPFANCPSTDFARTMGVLHMPEHGCVPTGVVNFVHFSTCC